MDCPPSESLDLLDHHQRNSSFVFYMQTWKIGRIQRNRDLQNLHMVAMSEVISKGTIFPVGRSVSKECVREFKNIFIKKFSKKQVWSKCEKVLNM